MEKSKKQEKLIDNSTCTCAGDNNTVSEKGKADFEIICNFADKSVSSQKELPDKIADFVDKHFWEMT